MLKKGNKLVCSVCGGVFYSHRDYAEKDGNKIAVCIECEKEWIIKRTHDLEEQLFYGISFPQLSGTRKQIEWANQLRKHYALDMLNWGVKPSVITERIAISTRAATWIEYSKYGTVVMNKALDTISNETNSESNVSNGKEAAHI